MLPDSVISIKKEAFGGCSSLTNITIGNSLTSIGYKAFNLCKSLETIIIPHSVTNIDSDAFEGCFFLEENLINKSTLDAEDNRYWGARIVEYDIDGLLISGTTVVKCRPNHNKTIIIPKNITRIERFAFQGGNYDNAEWDGVAEYIDNCLIRTSPNLFSRYDIKDGTRLIGNYAFFNHKSLKYITIPEGVTSIGDFAFNGCSELRSVNIPNSVTSIGECAFFGCSELKWINIPYGVTNIGAGAFLGTYIDNNRYNSLCIDRCFLDLGRYLSDIYDIEEGVRLIADEAFGNCKHLTSITIPDSVTHIGAGTFYNCESLTSITIPDSVNTIENGVFNNCKQLTSVAIPNGITNIGAWAFYGCESLTSITIPESVKNIEREAFSKCTSLTSITIPDTVMNLGAKVFLGCESLMSMVIGNNVKSIGKQAFEDCYELISIKLPNTVERIGNDAFKNCSKLTNLYLPNDVKSLNSNCDKISSNIIKGCKGLKVLHLPNNIIIEEFAFQDFSELQTINIPIGVNSIPKGAFRNCTSLKYLSLPDSVTEIQEQAFYDCSLLEEIALPKYLEKIPAWCFRGCTNLRQLVIPNSVIEIGEKSLIACHSLTRLHIPESVTKIDRYAIGNCENLTTIKLPNTLEEFGENALYNLPALKEICIPKGKRAKFLQMGLEKYNDKIVERDDEEVSILLNIAKGYELGIGMAKNLAQAVLIYSQAAEKGCAEAAYHLGKLYEKGEGLPQDYQRAIDWYTKAVSLYHPSAEERKKYCEQILQEEQHEAECQFETQQSQQTTKYVFFDTECNGLPFSDKLGVDDTSNWPRMIQLAWLVTDEHGNILKRQSHIIYPQGFIITNEVENLTGITTSRAKGEGVNLRTVLNEFMDDLVDAELVIGHNIDFDKHVLGCELYRERLDYDTLLNKKSVCTMQRSTNFCAIPNPNSYYGGYKWPKLEELHRKLFGCNIFGAHDALTDVEATKKCFYELKKKGIL